MLWRVHLDKDDSGTIAFVLECLWVGAIDVQELRAWADHALASADRPPHWLADLSTFTGYLKDVNDVIGFVPDREFGRDESSAVEGIAYARGRTPEGDAVTPRDRALACLRENPHVLSEFRETFPFIAV